MPIDGARPGRPWTYALMTIDALAYAVVVAVATIALSLVGAVATGGGLVRAKLLLFLAGWLYLSIAVVRLWPRSPAEAEAERAVVRSAGADSAGSTRIEVVASALPPLRWVGPVSRRLSPPTKLFVGSLLVLSASLILEVVFAVE